MGESHSSSVPPAHTASPASSPATQPDPTSSPEQDPASPASSSSPQPATPASPSTLNPFAAPFRSGEGSAVRVAGKELPGWLNFSPSSVDESDSDPGSLAPRVSLAISYSEAAKGKAVAPPSPMQVAPPTVLRTAPSG